MEEIINGVKVTYEDRDKLALACVGIFDILAQGAAANEDEAGNENETADGDGLNN